jgi:hypothetical protein
MLNAHHSPRGRQSDTSLSAACACDAQFPIAARPSYRVVLLPTVAGRVAKRQSELIPGENSRTTSFAMTSSRFSKARWLVFHGRPQAIASCEDRQVRNHGGRAARNAQSSA